MKKILTLLTISSLVILAGCASDPASENSNAGITEVLNQNENTEIVNENTTTNSDGESDEMDPPSDVSSEVLTKGDTSNWETYTNEEYGFSFKYPEEWAEPVVTSREADEYQTGSLTLIIFDGDRSRNGIAITPVVKIESIDYQFTGPMDGETISFSKVDLTQTEDQLRETLKLTSTIDNVVKKITTQNNVVGIRVDETLVSLGGEQQYYVEYLFPHFNSAQNLNIRVYGKKEIEQNIELLVNSLMINS